MRSVLARLAAYAATPALVAAIVSWRGLSWKDDIGVRRPATNATEAWLAGWVTWMVVSEHLLRRAGGRQPAPHRPAGRLEPALWIAGSGAAAPVAALNGNGSPRTRRRLKDLLTTPE